MVDFVIHNPNGTFVDVTDRHQLKTFAIAQSQLEDVSEDTGEAYSWYSTFTTSGVDEEVLTIRNDSNTLLLHVDKLWCGGLIASQFTFGFGTGGTPAGTPVTGRPLNIDKNQVADATAFGNAEVTGSVTYNIGATILCAADTSQMVDLEGAWILGKDDVFVVSSELADTIFVNVIGRLID